MDAFRLQELIDRQAETGDEYREFLRVPAMSLGLYVLPAGGEDTQTPHRQDEIYLVLAGRGMVHVVGEDRPVETDDLVFVAANAEHRFHSITEDLKLLVVFAPAYTGRA
jgi:mannose-6-phosphate isomerase-like protein (cupin superfamily)